MFGFKKSNMIDDFEFASLDKDYKCLKKIIKKAKDINEADNEGRTALMYALADGLEHEIIQLLIERGADVNHFDKQKWTPLHIAASYQNLEAVKILIENQADIDAQDKFGNTPLWRCSMNKEPNIGIVHILLKHGANPDLKNNANNSARDVAVTAVDTKLLEIFDNYIKSK
jgi:ankyrin repeat protein